jgi:cytidyltransferase-like protein
MRHCIYPGTFDPITCGHLDVLERAARLFDRVTVAIAENSGKGPFFTADQRLDMIRDEVQRPVGGILHGAKSRRHHPWPARAVRFRI